jgi:hypothetical protein
LDWLWNNRNELAKDKNSYSERLERDRKAQLKVERNIYFKKREKEKEKKREKEKRDKKKERERKREREK